MVRLAFFLVLVAGLGATTTAEIRPAKWAQPVIGSSLENFYRVSDDLYRSEQPRPSDLPDLKKFGIRSLLSLRHFHHDPRAFTQADLLTLQYEMDAGSVSVADLVAVLKIINAAPKPVLLHCWHGSDRTGFAIAGYRMVFMNWTADEAIDELRRGGFGLHEAWYPNIAKVLKEMDVAAVRKAILASDKTAAGLQPEGTK